MKIAYILFKDITWLDLIGVYDPVTRLRNKRYLPGLSWDFCALDNRVRDLNGLTVLPTITGKPLNSYDVIVVPGGQGTRTLTENAVFLQWLETAAAVPVKVSVCTGSLLLGAAGFLKDKKATTNYKEYEWLRPFCKEVLTDRIVEDNGVITAGAVTASIDLGLYLCRKWAGEDAAQAIRTHMDYRG